MIPFFTIAPVMPEVRPSPSRALADGKQILAMLLTRGATQLTKHISMLERAVHVLLQKLSRKMGSDSSARRFSTGKARQLLSGLALLLSQAARCRKLVEYAIMKALSFKPNHIHAVGAAPAARKTLALQLFNTRLEMSIAWGNAAPAAQAPASTSAAIPDVPAAVHKTTEGASLPAPSSEPSSPEKGFRALAKYSLLEGGAVKASPHNSARGQQGDNEVIPAKRAGIGAN